MDENKIEQMLLVNSSKFPPESFPMLKERLCGCEPSKVMLIFSTLKDPTVALIFSIFLGFLGVDRFYIGSVGMGVGKLVTCGGAYVWWLIDCFMIMDATRQKNLEKVMLMLQY